MSTEDHIPLYLITTPEESTLWWLSIVSDPCEHLVASATSWIDTLCLSPSSKQPTPKSRVDETARYGLRWCVLLFHLENILVSTESSHWRSLKFFEDSARMLSAKISAHPRLATMSETTSAASRAASWWKIRVPLDIEKSELACVGTNSLRLYFRFISAFPTGSLCKKGQHLQKIPLRSSTKIFELCFPSIPLFFWYGSMALPLVLYTGGGLFFFSTTAALQWQCPNFRNEGEEMGLRSTVPQIFVTGCVFWWKWAFTNRRAFRIPATKLKYHHFFKREVEGCLIHSNKNLSSDLFSWFVGIRIPSQRPKKNIEQSIDSIKALCPWYLAPEMPWTHPVIWTWWEHTSNIITI